MKSRITGLAAVLMAELVAVFALAGPALAGGPKPSAPLTTAPDIYVNVNVTMTNTKFILSTHSGPRGAYARFIIHNVSNKTHDFALGKAKYGSGLQTGFHATVKPGQKKILLLFLDYRGKVPYYPGLRSDSRDGGMKGTFDIGPCTHREQVLGVPEC